MKDRTLILTIISILALGTAPTGMLYSQVVYPGGKKELLSFDEIDARVRNGISKRDWHDNKTLPGWWGRAADKPAYEFFLTHGSNPAAGLQVFVDSVTHKPLALGSLVNTDRQNALLAVGIQNATDSVIETLTIGLEQIQWFGGTGAMADSRIAWFGIGGQNMSGVTWNKCPGLDMKNFVTDKGGLGEAITVTRTTTLKNLDWKAGEILWIRWIDRRVGGGNAGAGIASLTIESP